MANESYLTSKVEKLVLEVSINYTKGPFMDYFIIKTSTMTHPDYWTAIRLSRYKRLHDNASAFVSSCIWQPLLIYEIFD